jgi:hypothetical protein
MLKYKIGPIFQAIFQGDLLPLVRPTPVTRFTL